MFEEDQPGGGNLPRLLIALAVLCVAVVVWNVYPKKSHEDFLFKFFAGKDSSYADRQASDSPPEKATKKRTGAKSGAGAKKNAGLEAKQMRTAPDPDVPISATPRSVARMEAGGRAGRKDPFQPIQGYKPFPRPAKLGGIKPGPDITGPPEIAREDLLPPPPPGLPAPGNMNDIPPEVSSPYGGVLTMQELPLPPEKPSVADKMKLLAVVGDRAILGFKNDRLRLANKWPKTVTLGPGESFESVRMIQVKGDTVLLDEDGERSIKDLGPIM